MGKVFIQESTLTSIGDAIRAKSGKSDLISPTSMATEIANLPSGGGDFEIPVITGVCDYRFANSGWDWFIQQFGTQIETSDIVGSQNMFSSSFGLTEIPFTINYATNLQVYINGMFTGASNLEKLPKITNCKPYGMLQLFMNCYKLREISSDFMNGIDWSGIDEATDGWTGDMGNLFFCCFSLRSVPQDFFIHHNKYVSIYSSIFWQGFQECYVLDELTNLPVIDKTDWYDNAFHMTFDNCFRLKEITFETNANGTPKTARWCGQHINLSNSVGWTDNSGCITNYNSGITEDKKVVSLANYEKLKNDPDWFAMNYSYSRYNKQSAINTIKSLPDTSAFVAEQGNPNVITFKGQSGFYTDGAAVNTMTEEQIAVATAKGWTVAMS